MTKFITGNIFDSEMQTLVNPVNCVGVMGAGLARQFKIKYPRMFNIYKDLCANKRIQTGQLHLFLLGARRVLLFPTKKHWINPSKIEYIISGLNFFIKNYKRLGVTSIAFPLLGCGLGTLNESVVKKLMIDKLKDVDILIEIYQLPKKIEEKK